jgi:anti-sigma regulatory factor (Ser/Thr protein kinase)
MCFKARVIISELLTNTIKHTQQQTAVLEVEIYKHSLQFVRRDHSLPLQLPATESREALIWPLHEKYHNTKMVVYEDDLNALWITITPPGTTRFSVTPKPADTCNINSLHEHFGLLLVTLSSDSFTYDYNADTGENVFVTFIRF